MRIVYKSEASNLTTDPKSFSAVSRVVRLANKHTGAKLVLDMKKVLKFDGNLNSVYAALNFNLNRSRNTLRILPEKGKGTDIKLGKDMFGYYSTWECMMEETFKSGSTRVYAFDLHDYYSFNDYLLHSAFRKDWKRRIPYDYILSIKQFLRDLFQNASEHSNSDSPIFVSSSFDGENLRFTMIDCGRGFLESVGKNSETIVNEVQAIEYALDDHKQRAEGKLRSLRLLGDYCVKNNGDLLIISGGAAVVYDKNGFHESAWMPGAFRGAAVNLSIKVEVPEFLLAAA